MPQIHFDQINFLAVIAAAAATFVLGGIWYSALFKNMWISVQGYTEAQVAEMKAKMNPAKFFGGMLLAYFIIALAMAVMFQRFDIGTAFGGAKVGLGVWIIVACVELTGQLASNKKFAALAIDGLFQLIFFVGMGAILGGWHK
jgi:hypothetical protein